jgi:MraZ protein
MFSGEFEYKIDDKGRVLVPPRFRKDFKDGMVLTSGPENYIIAYTLKEFN